MDKVARLASGDLDHAVKAYESYTAISSLISDRMNYIIHFCVETVGGTVDWWDWQNGGDGEDKAPGDFMHSYSKFSPETLQITGEWKCGSKMKLLDKDGDTLDLAYGEIPTRWLHEDFEEEYVKGLQLYKEKNEQKNRDAAASKAQKKKNREALLASAKSKLTPEEIQALRIR